MTKQQKIALIIVNAALFVQIFVPSLLLLLMSINKPINREYALHHNAEEIKEIFIVDAESSEEYSIIKEISIDKKEKLLSGLSKVRYTFHHSPPHNYTYGIGFLIIYNDNSYDIITSIGANYVYYNKDGEADASYISFTLANSEFDHLVIEYLKWCYEGGKMNQGKGTKLFVFLLITPIVVYISFFIFVLCVILQSTDVSIHQSEDQIVRICLVELDSEMQYQTFSEVSIQDKKAFVDELNELHYTKQKHNESNNPYGIGFYIEYYDGSYELITKKNPGYFSSDGSIIKLYKNFVCYDDNLLRLFINHYN